MIKQDFMDERRARWQRLELVTRKLESSRIHRMAQDELDEFIVLYRAACSDLARARSEELGDDVEMYLNDLVARGHKQFRPPSSPDKRGFIRFFTHDFPRSVRAHWSYVLVATLLFVVPTVISAWAVVQDPDVAYSLSDPAQLEMLTEAYAEGHQGGRSEGEDSMMAGFYVYNNVGIAFKCFAMGVFFGLGSIFFLVLNGVFGGAVGAYICVAGYSESFLSFVIGHGSFELTAIVLSGAIGLRLGTLLVNPGEYTRMGALKVHGRSMINVIMGCAAMLLIAAGLEGFWSPSGAPPSVKFIVGGCLWLLVFAYLIFAGRGGDDRAKATDGSGGAS